MNWEAIGAISQIVGAVLVGITLIYLAVQLRQNTSALKSSAFLAISTLMGSTMEVWATHSDLAPLLIKAQAGLDELSPDERARFGFLMMMAFRRVETVVVQRHLGFIDRELTEGFERSALSALHAKGVRQWWDASKGAFSNLFSAWVDEKLASNLPLPIHDGLGLGVSPIPLQGFRWILLVVMRVSNPGCLPLRSTAETQPQLPTGFRDC